MVGNPSAEQLIQALLELIELLIPPHEVSENLTPGQKKGGARLFVGEKIFKSFSSIRLGAQEKTINQELRFCLVLDKVVSVQRHPVVSAK